MSGRNESSYVSLLKDIVQLAWDNVKVQLMPNFITTDYERALRNALKEVFGAADHYGCITHFSRAANKAYMQKVWRTLTELNPEDVRAHSFFPLRQCQQLQFETARRFFALTKTLAYLPPEEIIDAYNDLHSKLTETVANALSEYDKYFRRTWLAGTFRLNLPSSHNLLQSIRRMNGRCTGGQEGRTTSSSRSIQSFQST